MSPRSSSDSASAARGVDVIDLDRFMRGVRPDRDRLVVDGGGARRVVADSSDDSRRIVPRRAHDKRASHDSGLSDDSYGRQKRTRHRRVSAGDGLSVCESGRSLRAFRAGCERELRAQRRQLARVQALCERLANRPPIPPAPPAPRAAPRLTSSSSSRSTSDDTKRDEHRAEECKTYKLIMTKLDELNRAFLARRKASPRISPRPAPCVAASACVSTSDKIVATEYNHKINTVQKTKRSTETHSPRLVERAVGEAPAPVVRDIPQTDICNERSDERSTRVSTIRAVTPAFAMDYASRDTEVSRCPKIFAQSTVNYVSSDEEIVNTCDPRCGFDLDNPVHLYAQAKRLRPRECGGAGERGPTPRVRGSRGASGSTLCSLCRSCWRSLRVYLAAQFFNGDQPTGDH